MKKSVLEEEMGIEFDEYDNDDLDSNTTNQLQLHLLEPRAKRTSSINMLDFWKGQQYRIFNEYRSPMKHDVVETLVCTTNWLFGEKGHHEEVSIGGRNENCRLNELLNLFLDMFEQLYFV
uniref:HAT C-terminal dimerisation domain-containing protein n=1 Tax=Lactuca sativa TaxID=4236 RepID=A0A9R1UK56_LACSA|nr:hypothetical protein LSAT_V11C900489460 [Lactuca sativa]